MSNDEIQIIGKKVKDMYGTLVGKVVGTISDIDGSIQTVGIDCGAEGLKQIEFEQLVVQGEVVIFIPKWRLESQRLLREKSLTLRRLKALIEIVSENDEMKERNLKNINLYTITSEDVIINMAKISYYQQISKI